MCVVWQASGKTGIIKSVISSLPENKIFGHFLCRVRAYLFTEALVNTSTGGLTDLSKNKYTPSNTSTEHLLLRLLLSFDVGCGLVLQELLYNNNKKVSTKCMEMWTKELMQISSDVLSLAMHDVLIAVDTKSLYVVILIMILRADFNKRQQKINHRQNQ